MPLKDVQKNKEYHAKYMREVWYPKNKERHKTLVAKRNRLLKKEIKEFLTILKQEKACSCGEQDYKCLDFHHIDPTTKKFNIGDAVRERQTKRAILEEISKCEVLCANCHRKLHY